MKRRRYHAVKAKPGELKFGWGREDSYNAPDAMVAWGDGVDRANGNFLLMALCHETFGPKGVYGPMNKSILAELEARGFDPTTIKFTIQKKAE